MKIFKYLVSATGRNVVPMPKGAKLMSAFMQADGKVAVYALVDAEAKIVNRDIYVFGTGFDLPPVIHVLNFAGTVTDGTFVWHVFG